MPRWRQIGILARDSHPAGNPNQIFFGIDRALSPAQFEMQLRPADITRPAHPGNDLAAPDDVTALYQNNRAVRIGRHPTAGMFDQYQIAKPL